ncbi:histidine phosphatase family protein [Proteiniborus sp. MB09-C3]|uniref:histidine phosphatase family protein n=1 Tax=Proteiniborus sp. MB09-C3 TaxID=3050072 RepID=UPI002553C59D|nr:histidine phosphatase family protein [Proteiniborus sp. MB09-C3]WIV11788.1 histidine phosphatase family protein [Proteiniborus sp. MB09-C3]
MKFILVRHGETEANIGGIYSGWTDFPLTEKGNKDIQATAKNLKRYKNVDIIYSSPLNRALTTAKAISASINKEIQIVDNLKEMNFGIFDGKEGQYIQKNHDNEWKSWIEDYVNYRIPEGENLIDLYDRIKVFLDKLIEKDKDSIIVTHGGVIQVMITHLLDLGLDKMWHFQCPPAGYAEIEYVDNFGFLRRLT